MQTRDDVRPHVLEVLALYGVTPSGRGTGVGDVEYWIDVILAAKGWEQYWADKIAMECERAGYTRGGAPPAPTPQPIPDYLTMLNRIESKVDFLTTKLSKYF